MKSQVRVIFGTSIFSVMGLLAGISLAACTPSDDQGQCVEDADCQGRGLVCQTTLNECVEREQDYSTTAEPTPASTFTDKAIPFFRGRVCTAKDQAILAGAPVPVTLQPCLHPCIEPGAHVFQHEWDCQAAVCSARTVFWVEGDGTNCPAEAWGEFDQALCDYSKVSISSSLGTIELDGQPLEALLTYEIPFLTNIDVQNIADYRAMDRAGKMSAASDACLERCNGVSDYENCLQSCFNRETVFAYVQQPNRSIDINLANANPSPPDDCNADPAACDCIEIGF